MRYCVTGSPFCINTNGTEGAAGGSVICDKSGGDIAGTDRDREKTRRRMTVIGRVTTRARERERGGERLYIYGHLHTNVTEGLRPH